METRTVTLRRRAGPLRLLTTALGGPRAWGGKARRLVRTLGLWADRGEIARRLDALERAGLAPARPSRLQLLFGGADMLRFVITPAAQEYYARQEISFAFHQLLRVLDDPASLMDPTGFFSDRETIVGHVMQVVHLNPIFDVQLASMFEGGLEDLERQLEQMRAGTHPRAATIAAVVEEPDYHARLLDYVQRYRRDPAAPPPIRPTPELRRDPRFVAAERTFASLPGYLLYSARLPDRLPGLLRHLARRRRFPLEEAVA